MSRPKILLVDDEPMVVTALARLLRVRGFEVLEAHDGKTGLATAIEHTPDYVVSDVRMPRMDGPTMARALRAHHRAAGTVCPPIVIVTGYADLTETDVLELPVRLVLSKPARLREILEALDLPT